MPELPEVECTRRGLELCLGQASVIRSMEIIQKHLRFPIPSELPVLALSQPILDFRRRAKYLLFDLPHITLVSHLGMSGTWRLAQPEEERRKHDHVRLHFTTGKTLIYNDPRRFGILDYFHREEETSYPRFSRLGLEPLNASFSSLALWKLCRNRKVAIKTLIMNQAQVVGIGNIYACEALFLAKLHPSKLAKCLNQGQAQDLTEAITKILTKAIALGGSSISDFRHTNGQSGRFQNHFQVYGREHSPCHHCGTAILRAQHLKRSSYFCPNCQKG